MIPASHPITHTRGDTYELFGRVRDKVWDAEKEEYVPGPYKNITGWVGLAQMRETYDDPEPKFTFRVTLGDQGVAPGSFFIRLEPEDTQTVEFNGDKLKGKWELQWTTPANEDFTYLGGTFILKKDIAHV